MNDFQKYLDNAFSEPLFKETSYDDGLMKQISHILKSERKRKKISQKELSSLSGITQANISMIEKGNGNTSIKQIEKLFKALGIKLIIEVRQ